MGVMVIEIERIDARPAQSVRAGIRQDVIDDYVQRVDLPPGSCIRVDDDRENNYLMWDGMHRLVAAIKRGDKTFAMHVEEGTEDDAYLKAASSNQNHGLRRTNEDKRACVRMMLTRHPERSNVWIADSAGVSDVFVKNQRESDPRFQSDRRVGADGKTRQQPLTVRGSEPEAAEETPPEVIAAIERPTAAVVIMDPQAVLSPPELVETRPAASADPRDSVQAAKARLTNLGNKLFGELIRTVNEAGELMRAKQEADSIVDLFEGPLTRFRAMMGAKA